MINDSCFEFKMKCVTKQVLALHADTLKIEKVSRQTLSSYKNFVKELYKCIRPKVCS